MNITRRLILTACAALALAACAPKPHLTIKQIEGITGLSMRAVEARLGMADSVTNAGNSVWWEYDNVITLNGNDDGSCHVVFKNDVVSEVKC